MEGSIAPMNNNDSISGIPLTTIHQYHDRGFIVVRKLFDQVCQSAWVNECERLSEMLATADGKSPRFQGRAHLTKGHIFDRIDPVIDISPILRDTAQNAELKEICGQLIGEPATLLKDKLIAKPPGTFGYLIHQDYPYWEHLGIPADQVLTAWVAIDQAHEKNGALELFPGLHGARIPGTPDAPMDVDESLVDTTCGVITDLDPGDVLFFHSLAPHRSSPNRSDSHRRALLLTYVPERFGNVYEHFYRMKMH